MPHPDEAVEAHWKAFGEWLGALQAAVGLTSTEAARAASMTLTQWSRIRNGQSGTRRATLPRILRALRLSAGDPRYTETYRRAGFTPPVSEDRLDQELPPNAAPQALTPDDNLPRLIAFYDELSPEDRDELLQIAEMKWRRRRAQENTFGRKAEKDEA